MERAKYAYRQILLGKNKTEAKQAAAAAFGKTPRQIETDIGLYFKTAELGHVLPALVNEFVRRFGVRAHQLDVLTEEEGRKFAELVQKIWTD